MSNPETWKPDDEEIRNGQEGYLRYLGGVAIINKPDSTFARSLHHIELSDDNGIDGILTLAEQMMVYGLKQVIHFSNPPGERTRSRPENNFSHALPFIRHLFIDSSYDTHIYRINQMNEAFRIMRPAAITDRIVYRYIAHPRYEKLLTTRLLDVFPPAAVFIDELKGRNVQGAIVEEAEVDLGDDD